MAQKAGIDPGITERQRLAVDPHRSILQRADQVFSGIHQCKQVAAVVPAIAIRRRDKHFQRRIAGPGTHSGQTGIHADGSVLHRHDRIGGAEREIVMGMHAALGFGFEHPVIGLQPGGVIIHVHRPAAVGDIDTVRAIALHQQGLLRQRLGLQHVAHHQEPGNVHAQIARRLDMLFADIGFGAMRGDPHRTHAHCISLLKIVHRADAGQQQRGQHRIFQHIGNRTDPVPIGMRAKSIVE